MDSLLLYTTIGKSEEYLKCLEWFCKSLTYTTRTTLNVLVICDVSFHDKVHSIVKQHAFLNYYLMDVPNSTTPDEASMHKVKIFNFPQIFHFRTVLYVDLDCLFLRSLTFLFKKPIEDNKLYVFAERDAVEKNNLKAFSLSRENNKDVCYYTEEHWKFLKNHNKLPFNAGLFMFRCSPIMEQHFRKLNSFIKNFKGEFFYEQSFMNTYFHLNNVSDFSLFDRKNIFMFYNNKISDVTPEHNIVHFNLVTGEGKNKADAMSEYFTTFKRLHPAGFAQFDTRDEMIDQLIPSGGTIVEIGVFQGDFAEVLAKTNPKHLHLVDCWEAGGTGSGDVDGNNMKHFSSGEELWKSVKARYEFYPNISIHRQYSSEFLKSLKDSSIDVIYINGDHSYKGVKEDLNNAFPKVKKGGWIMGHDYEMNMKKANFVYEFGVKQAVDEFCKEKGLKLFAKALDGCVSYAIFVDFIVYNMDIRDQNGKSIDIAHIEKPEQDLAKQYIEGNDVVFELGARYGSVSCTINSKLNCKTNQVVVEPDERVWEALERNKTVNGCEFHIVKGFVSAKKMGLDAINCCDGYGTTSVEDSLSTIPSYTMQTIQEKYNIPKFNVLVADCEGFLEHFFDENPTFYDSLRLVMFEADYPDKCNYGKIRNALKEKGFTEKVNGHQNVWIKSAF